MCAFVMMTPRGSMNTPLPLIGANTPPLFEIQKMLTTAFRTVVLSSGIEIVGALAGAGGCGGVVPIAPALVVCIAPSLSDAAVSASRVSIVSCGVSDSGIALASCSISDTEAVVVLMIAAVSLRDGEESCVGRGAAPNPKRELITSAAATIFCAVAVMSDEKIS